MTLIVLVIAALLIIGTTIYVKKSTKTADSDIGELTNPLTHEEDRPTVPMETVEGKTVTLSETEVPKVEPVVEPVTVTQTVEAQPEPEAVAEQQAEKVETSGYCEVKTDAGQAADVNNAIAEITVSSDSDETVIMDAPNIGHIVSVPGCVIELAADTQEAAPKKAKKTAVKKHVAKKPSKQNTKKSDKKTAKKPSAKKTSEKTAKKPTKKPAKKPAKKSK